MSDLKPTVLGLAGDLAAGRTTSRALVEAALGRIDDQAGEGGRTFTRIYARQARAAADAQDQLRKAGYVASPLAGLPVSIKDLFDVAGEVTLAGSRALDDRPPATHDAPIVARLRTIAARRGADPSQIALAFVLEHPFVDVVLSGAATVAQLHAHVQALDVTLDDEARVALAELAEPPARYWETRGRLPWH